MTDAATIVREDTLYITDAELIRRMGVPEKIARAVIRELDPSRAAFRRSKILGGSALLARGQGLPGPLERAYYAALTTEGKAMSEAPKVENAPGLVWRERKQGWVAFWQCRSDLAKRGFKPDGAAVARHRAFRTRPTDDLRQLPADAGRHAGVRPRRRAGGKPYDGTIAASCSATRPTRIRRSARTAIGPGFTTGACYGGSSATTATSASPTSRARHAALARGWAEGGKIPMAHSLMGMTRTLFSFGMTLLECDDCARMCAVLSKQRFQMGKSRTERLTADMANLIRAKAHELGWHSIALAQAIQFEGMFRQKDMIGEWVPLAEPGTSDVIHNGEKWLRGILWSEIDQNLILRHVTSKRQKMVEIDLRLADMVMEEFSHIPDIRKMVGP
jgi:hypothetical protein